MLQPEGFEPLTPAADGSAPPRAPARPLPPVIDPSLRAGKKLAAARIAMGMTLEQASERLRISRDYLAALEAMNVKLIPGKAYARAFAKSYARLVGLDPDAIVSQFEDENALTREDISPQIRNPASKPARERPWLAALGIAIAITGFIGWRMVLTAEGDKRLVEAAAPEPAIVEPAARPATAASAAPVVVEIRALQPAWLEVRGAEGTIFISQTLQPGQAYRPDVGAGWIIHVKDGGAFEIAVAGVSQGPLGKPGAPVNGRPVDLIVEEAAARAAVEVARTQQAAVAAPAPTPAASRPAAPAAAVPVAASAPAPEAGNPTEAPVPAAPEPADRSDAEG